MKKCGQAARRVGLQPRYIYVCTPAVTAQCLQTNNSWICNKALLLSTFTYLLLQSLLQNLV